MSIKPSCGMHSRAECRTCVINVAFRDTRCKLREKIGVVVGTVDSLVSETIGKSATKLLTCDSIQDALVDSSVALIVTKSVEASIASGDTCNIDDWWHLVCFEGGRELAELGIGMRFRTFSL